MGTCLQDVFYNQIAEVSNKILTRKMYKAFDEAIAIANEEPGAPESYPLTEA